MKETLIYKLDKHCIYYLNNSYYGFYIFLPIKDFTETNITIRLKSNYQSYDLSKNSLENVRNELINYYQKLDNYNVTLILPVMYDDTLNRIATIEDLNIYQKIDQILGDIFNKAYMFLAKNNIKVNPSIYFIKNDTFSKFTNWFVNRYANRIEYKTLNDLVGNTSYTGYNTFETSNVNFVVSKEQKPSIDKTREISSTEVSNILQTINMPDTAPSISTNNTITSTGVLKENDTDNISKPVKKEPINKNNRKRESNNNAGFVSYLFLGIGTFIVSMILLYVLIK